MAKNKFSMRNVLGLTPAPPKEKRKKKKVGERLEGEKSELCASYLMKVLKSKMKCSP